MTKQKKFITSYALHKAEIGRGNQIPLWLLGFLY